MNSEKILIEINVAGVNRSFDCIVPRTLPAKLLCRGFLELVEQSMGIPFGAYRQALLTAIATKLAIITAKPTRAPYALAQLDAMAIPAAHTDECGLLLQTDGQVWILQNLMMEE